MQLNISYNNSNYQYKSTTTFGAKAQLCEDLTKIMQNSSPTKTDYLQRMFESFQGDTPVLFNLSSNVKTKENEIVAINLNNGEIFPQGSPATKDGLNNLMGYLMCTYKDFCKNFWGI